MSQSIAQPTTAIKQKTNEISFWARFAYRRRHWIGFLFIAPWLLSVLWFDVIPFFVNLYLSFTDYSVGLAIPNWIGLENYREMFTEDDLYLKSLGNTITYLVMSIPLRLLTAFVIALILNTRIFGLGTFRTIFYIPSVVPIVATAIIFTGIFNARYGILNQLLIASGLDPIRWLTRPEWIKPSMVIMSMWGFGAQMVIFLAGLQGIPQELYEAADIDGASWWQKLMNVTVPLMTPVIFFNLIIGIIGGFQVFASAYVLIGVNGGPLQAGLFYVLHLYNNAFSYFKMGYASAMSVILFLIILVFTLITVRSSDRWVYYGDG
ncbi:sugar ABC transporter permease [Chloroflexi bacterium TSY]|nr:sugar ABC transporter permease [Chloroflexi bacterium TSY]